MDITWTTISLYTLGLILTGYLLPMIKPKKVAIALSVSIVPVTMFVVAWVTAENSPLIRMTVLISLLLLTMKIIVIVVSRNHSEKLRFIQWLAFLCWPGMRPGLFESFPSRALIPASLLTKGIVGLLAGYLLIFLSRAVENTSGLNAFFIPQLLLLGGLSLMLHFGIINLLAGLWRSWGVHTTELFRSPYRSGSLREFWGKRWNSAYTEMTSLIAYRPLKPIIGLEKAIIVSFLLSGLLHELAISFPVRSGYGMPMLYFGIHAFAMQLESKSNLVQQILRNRVLAHFWVLLFLMVPLPLLFHTHFIQEVLIPLRETLLPGTKVTFQNFIL